MYLLVLGLALLTLKWMEVDPVANWSWLLILAPFALALLWWAWADSSGFTKRRAAEREQARKQERLDQVRANMNSPLKSGRRK